LPDVAATPPLLRRGALPPPHFALILGFENNIMDNVIRVLIAGLLMFAAAMLLFLAVSYFAL